MVNLGLWLGEVELRWLGPQPLVSDNSLTTPGYKEVNCNVGYKVTKHVKVQVSVFNFFNTTARGASRSAYQYRVSPTAPIQFGATYHPLEPLSARLTECPVLTGWRISAPPVAATRPSSAAASPFQARHLGIANIASLIQVILECHSK